MATCTTQYFDSALTFIKKQSTEAAHIDRLFQDARPTLSKNQYKPSSLIASRIEFSEYNKLLALGAKYTQQTLLGFYLGQDIKSADYGELGYLVETCKDLAQAINALLQYESIVADFAKTSLTINETQAHIIWTPMETCNRQVSLRNITAWTAITRLIIGEPLELDALHLTDDYTPAERKILASWFGCPVTTSSQETKLIFPRAYLSLTLGSANESLNQVFNSVSQQSLMQLQAKNNLTELINDYLNIHDDLRMVTQDAVAQQFHISTRTLQRKLQKEHTCFFDLFDQARKYRALKDIGKMPMSELAQACGFSEQSALNKAFKRWFNCSPSAYLAAIDNNQ